MVFATLAISMSIVLAKSTNAQNISDIIIDIKMDNASLVEIFNQIENKTELEFAYQNGIFSNRTDTYSLNYSQISLEEVLKVLSSKAQISFKQINSSISVKPIPQQNHSSKMVEQIKVSGTVRDSETGEPLIGAIVRVKSGSQGTVTDIDGKYKLSISDENTILLFSYVGYQAQEIDISHRSTIDVSLLPDMQSLDEMVVVGYGAQKEVNVTGAVNQISGESLESRPISDLTQGLQGLIPNLNITFGNGMPGQDASVNIRGNTSINGGEPLVLVDGIPGDINRINPQDVASVTVLKDASASAIYGARGSFGVIIITTKSGKDTEGELRVNYAANYGWSTPTTKTDFITNGYEWVSLVDRAFLKASGNTYSGFNEDDYAELEKRRFDVTENPDRPWVVTQNRSGKDQYVYYGNFDWYNYLFTQWQPSREHNLSLSGGTEKLNFLISGRYYNKEGIMKLNTDEYDYYSFRSKITGKLNKVLTVSNNTQFNTKKYNYYGVEGGGRGNFTTLSQHASPSYVPINPDGTLSGRTGLNNYWITAGGLAGNLREGKTGGSDRSYQLSTLTEAKLNLGQGLEIVGNYSYSLFTTKDFYRTVPSNYSLFPGQLQTASKFPVDRLKETSRFDQYFVGNVYGTYQKQIGKHHVKFMAGYNEEHKTLKTTIATKNDLISQDLNDFNLATGNITLTGGASEWALRGLFGRFNYGYKDKYLVEFSGRYDGTSRFSSEDRWGFFPSFSAGWRISDEAFFEPLRKVTDNLKFRVSYGSLGNQQVDNYAFTSSMDVSSMDYVVYGSLLQSTESPNPISGSLTWEKVTSSNIGVDIDFFEGKLSYSFDGYVRNTFDMLTKGMTLPSVFGAPEPKQNAADLRTKGFESTLKWRDEIQLANRPFKYNIGIVLSDYTAKITKYDNPENILSDYYVGQELGEMWGYLIDGYFVSDAEAANYEVDQSRVNNTIQKSPGEWGQLRAGDLKFVDVNGDGKINNGQNTLQDPGDRVKIGNSQPRYMFGINLGANWNNFDFSGFFQGVGKKDWYPGRESDRFWGVFSRPYYSFIPEGFEEKIWTPENPDSYFPALRGYSAFSPNSQLSVWNNRYLQNVGYIRLKNLTVGYTLPKSLTEKIHVSRCRFYFSGENLLTLSTLKTKYIDPEQVNRNSDNRDYPFSKTYSVGLNVSF